MSAITNNNFNKNKGIIYLSGGGDKQQSSSLDRYFFDSLEPGASLVYIPEALRGNKMFEGAEDWLRGVLKLHDRTDIQLNTLHNLNCFTDALLNNSDGVYIGGGNTWHLASEIQKRGLHSLFRHFYKSGGQLYGGSAGGILLGEDISAQDDDKNDEPQTSKGLNLLAGFSVSCHYDEKKSSHLQCWVKSNSIPLLCLPEDCGLIFNGEYIKCVGDSPCVKIGSDLSVLRISPGEKITDLPNS